MSLKRTPKGIRRHYSKEEKEFLIKRGPIPSTSELGRPLEGTSLKADRITGRKVDRHWKDPSGKYLFQEETKALAERNGKPWEPWEDAYLFSDTYTESLKDKAIYLQRTYRAVESRRRDLMRDIDKRKKCK